MPLPTNPDVLLTRADAAAALTEAGYPVAKSTLATKATRGGGPPYIVFNGRALYKWAELLAWAAASSTAKVTSTSEFDALHSAAMQRIAVATN